LDVFVPQLNLALEYHGKQHDQPIDFFGGEEGFEQRQKLDRRKRRLCKRNGIVLLEIREGYDPEELINHIGLSMKTDT